MTRLSRGENISTDAFLSILVWLGLDGNLRPFITTSEEEVTECSSEASTPTKNER